MNSAINVINSKIDRRKSYYLVLDTETANGLDTPLMYDVGGCICDKRGIKRTSGADGGSKET